MQRIGIIGLPNVGKSTLFSALTRVKVASANYPFTTIDPNIASVELRDPRLESLAKLLKSKRIIPATIEFVDIAGLVRNASKGEGRGNSFLADIRGVDLIVHVIRCFEAKEIIHVDGNPNPLRDLETINLELIMSDLERVEMRLSRFKKLPKNKQNEDKIRILENFFNILSGERLLNQIKLSKEEEELALELQLLTSKPTLYLANISEEDLQAPSPYLQEFLDFSFENQLDSLTISASLEAQLLDLSQDQAKEYLNLFKQSFSGLDLLVFRAFKMLGLATFFTAGPKEVRAWVFRLGAKAVEAAALIHSDFSNFFIRARVIGFQDFLDYGSELAVREAGKQRIEGKDYLVKDGDIIHFLAAK